MQIPKFWASASREVKNAEGQLLQLKCWGWSVDFLSEAQSKAQQALQRLADRVSRSEDLPDTYAYGTRALREEIIQEMAAPDSSVSGVVTRNSYGALVLNTSRVLFIDVDVPPEPEPSRDLFSWKKSAKPDPFPAVLSKIQSGLDRVRGSFQIYRTAAGFRVLATDPLYEPGSSDAEKLMEMVEADPSFVKLCRAQRSFRARLTPKPWRCGKPKPPVNFPRENPKEEEVFRQWLADYDCTCARWATCQRVQTVGPGDVQEEARLLLELHDRLTKSASALPLA